MTLVTPKVAPAAGPVGANAYDLQSCMLESHRVARLSEAALLAEFTATLARDRGTTVDLLIQIGEIDERRLYRPRACPDMVAYCTDVLHMSGSTANRRVRAARAARRFPVLLPMVAEGRLHLSAVSLLAPHLTPANAAELLAEATHKSKAEVELVIARRFPRSDVPECERPLGSSSATSSPTAQVVANIAAQLSPVTVVPARSEDSPASTEPLPAPLDEPSAVQKVFAQALGEAAAKCGAESLSQPVLSALAGSLAEVVVNAAAAVAPKATAQAEVPARVTPRSAGRFAWQLTADQDMQDLLDEARQLIGFSGSRELAHVLKRGLELLVQALRKQKCAATARPRPTPKACGAANGRHVPRSIVREVIARDGGQCTFVGPDGRRCSARSSLEIDHVIPYAKGGPTSTDNLRLLCAAHNQHEAERVLGKQHMQAQRAARRARTERSQRAKAAVRASEAARATREPDGSAVETRPSTSP